MEVDFMVVMVQRLSPPPSPPPPTPSLFDKHRSLEIKKFKGLLLFLLTSINKILYHALQTKSLTTKSCEAEVCIGIFLKAKGKKSHLFCY